MNYTNTPINQLASLNQRTSFRERLSLFIEQHAGVFQALTRHGLPYGGNWLPALQPDALPATELTAENMVEIERELDDIILRLSQLSSSLNGAQNGTGSRSTGREIGIKRYRALQFGA